MRILDELETIRACAAGSSLARFQDGELSYIFHNTGHRHQRMDGALRERLREVLAADVPNLLIGIPRILPPDNDSLPVSTGGCKRFWMGSWQPLVRKRCCRDGVTYGSAFISYPDRHLPREKWLEARAACGALWHNRDVVLVGNPADCYGKRQAARQITGKRLLAFIECPPKGAWFSFSKMLDAVRQHPTTSLVLVSMGVSGTVLAHDLAVEGYHAVDIGRLLIRLGRMEQAK